MATIKTFKLVSGEEVVARVSERTALIETVGAAPATPTTYELHRPMTIQLQPVAPGKFGLAFVPYALSNPEVETITVSAANVVAVFEPAKEVERQYLQQTTGLELATATVS
jgi:hypothetical protein